VSFAVNLMKLWGKTRAVDPRPRGGFRHGKLKPHRDFILETVTARGDITMPELAKELRTAKGLKVTESALSKFLISRGFSFKLPASHPPVTSPLGLGYRFWHGLAVSGQLRIPPWFQSSLAPES